MIKTSFQAVSLLLWAMLPSSVHAEFVVDFESVNLNGNTFEEFPSPLTFSDIGGSGIDAIFTQTNDMFRVYDLVLFGSDTTGQGQALLGDFAGTTITFSSPVSNLSLRAGDFGGDSDAPLTVSAFDATGQLLATDAAGWGANQFPPFETLELNVSGIDHVVYESGGAFLGSTFIDDVRFSATSVPEPSSVCLVAIASLAVFVRRRRVKE